MTHRQGKCAAELVGIARLAVWHCKAARGPEARHDCCSRICLRCQMRHRLRKRNCYRHRRIRGRVPTLPCRHSRQYCARPCLHGFVCGMDRPSKGPRSRRCFCFVTRIACNGHAPVSQRTPSCRRSSASGFMRRAGEPASEAAPGAATQGSGSRGCEMVCVCVVYPLRLPASTNSAAVSAQFPG